MGLEALNQFSAHEKERFQVITNKLFASCYLYKHTDKDYYFILTHQDVFMEFFALANWTLNIDNQLEIIYLTSAANSTRYRFSLKETILLLLLRIIFEEQAKHAARYDKILCSVADLQAKYAALKLKDRNIDKQGLINALSVFRRFNIIDVVTQSDNFANSLISINPTILVVVRVQSLKEVIDKIEAINKKGGDENVSIEEIEVD